LEPAYIGSVRTRNRIVKSAASMCYWHEDDIHMSEQAKAYYGAVARGGVGLLIIESPDVDYPYGTRWRERFRIDDDRYITGMAELAEAVHAHGCPTFVQFWHDGPWQSPMGFGTPKMFEGPPIGASPVNLDAPGDFHRDVPRQLTIAEIEGLIEKFVNAALRVQKAGFDGIELNAGSSHLFHNFLSPFWNRREDEYGGSVENRARLLLTVIGEIKRLTGPDFALSVLLNGFEIGRLVGIDDDKCLTHQQALAIARLVEKAGADALQIRNHWLGQHVGGFFPDYLFYPEAPIPLREFPQEYNARLRGAGANVRLTEAMKRVVSIPVMIVGKVSPELGEQYLREGKADFIVMTRRLQCDPEMPNKLKAGKIEEAVPCTGCGTCLDQSRRMDRRCRVNAAMGAPTIEDYTLQPATTRKKVVVVGGGPAGMEAARVAAARGHEVTLLEKNSRLGGLVPLAALVKGAEPEELPPWLAYLERELRRLGVTVALSKGADADFIVRLAPEVVIVATGGRLVAPAVDTADEIGDKVGEKAGGGRAGRRGQGPRIVTAPDLHRQVKPLLNLFGPRLLERLTHVWLPIGKRVVVIGGSFHGCEIAEFLAKRGRKVTIVEPSDIIGTGVIDFRLGPLLEWFARRGVDTFTGAAGITVTAKGVSFRLPDGSYHEIEADTVIPTAPVEPDTTLVEQLQGRVGQVFAVGDCREAGMMVDAVAAGWAVAREI
jgi:2,4-dienoyl-CoA reductase (NADPH2)